MKVSAIKNAGTTQSLAVVKLIKAAFKKRHPQFIVESDGTVNAPRGTVVVTGGGGALLVDDEGRLKVKFGTVKTFDIDGHLLGLRSFKGLPDRITGTDIWGWSLAVSMHRLAGPKEIDYLPDYVAGGIDLSAANSLETLTGIQNFLKGGMNGSIILADGVQKGLLGLLLIKGLTNLQTPQGKAQRIVSQHLALEGPRDLLACQEELIDAGFEEAATL